MPPQRCVVSSLLGPSAGSCPPAWVHPPVMARGPSITHAAVLTVYLLLQMMLRAACDALLLSSDAGGSIVSLYLHLALLCTMGYALVSLHMHRPIAHSLCSRYGGFGEFAKLHRLLPWLMLVALIGVLRERTAEEERTGQFISTPTLLFPASTKSLGGGFTLLTPLSTLPLSFILSFFVALHFTFLDGSRTLQVLGCKLPLPSMWPQLTQREVLIVVGTAVGVVAALAPSLYYLLAYESAWWLLLCFVAISGVQIYLADMLHTGSGSLATSGAAGSGLEAPMSGRLMWRTKLSQLVSSLTPAPPVSPPFPPVQLASPLVVGGGTASPPPMPAAPPQIYLHVHHYLWGVLLLPLLRFPCVSAYLVSGALLGICVEGVCVWGMDPLLVCKRPPTVDPLFNQAHAALMAAHKQASATAARSVEETASLL